MKELSIEEKAKAYDKVVNKLKGFMIQGVDPLITRADVQDFFPELAESEDEKIRKEMIEHLEKTAIEFPLSDVGLKADSWIAYLEKQGERKHQYKSRPRYVGEGELLGKKISNQKTADKVEAKFKVGDFIQFKGMGHTRYTIKEVCGLSHYINTCDKRMDMSYTDANFELVEQKPAAWSHIDENRINNICDFIQGHTNFTDSAKEAAVVFLKSLKDRYTWKPSKEQMEALWNVYQGGQEQAELATLYNDLKKLREE